MQRSLLVAVTVGMLLCVRVYAQRSPPSPIRPTPTPSAPALAGTLAADHVVHFDPRQVSVRRVGRSWCLMAADVCLKDFSGSERDARIALRAVRSLQLTEQIIVGRPQPILEFYLVNGQAPGGMVNGINFLRFDLGQLELRSLANQWVLLANGVAILSLGSDQQQAERALGFIRHYGFTQVGKLGPGNQAMTIFLGSAPGRRLPVTARRDFHNNDSRQTRSPLRPNPAPGSIRPAGHWSGAGTRVPFDFRQATLRRVGDDWKIVAGSRVLKEFGKNERDGREALRAIRYYRFTERHEIGSSGFEYYLVHGQAPRGRLSGHGFIPMRPDELSVRQMDGIWWIAQPHQPLFRFNDPQEATQALEVIRRYGFDHVCFIGRPEPVMMYLVRTR